MKLFLFFISIFLFVSGCVAQSQLPKEMPENFSVSLREDGGMSPRRKVITLKDNVLQFEERITLLGKLNKWSADISAAETAKLYQILVENEFDTIKNDPRRNWDSDAGSNTISIHYGNSQTFQVTAGKNSPLSGKNSSRYQEVRKAFDEIVERAQRQRADNVPGRNIVPAKAEKYLPLNSENCGEAGDQAQNQGCL
jgi:hypothetical protein